MTPGHPPVNGPLDPTPVPCGDTDAAVELLGVDCSEVRLFDRRVDETLDPIETAFQLLVAGPNAEEAVEGAGSFFTNETEGMVRSATLTDGRLIVDFEDLRPVTNNASTSCGRESAIAQLNATAFQFEDVAKVRYEIDGNCDTFFNWLQSGCQEFSRT